MLLVSIVMALVVLPTESAFAQFGPAVNGKFVGFFTSTDGQAVRVPRLFRFESVGGLIKGTCSDAMLETVGVAPVKTKPRTSCFEVNNDLFGIEVPTKTAFDAKSSEITNRLNGLEKQILGQLAKITGDDTTKAAIGTFEERLSALEKRLEDLRSSIHDRLTVLEAVSQSPAPKKP